MSDINRNDVESLFATKRKQQQAEDAQKAAQLAESEKFAELQRKKREMEEEISRLQSIKEKQEETTEAVKLITAKGPLPVGGF